ncbi:MAG: amidohydrolase, partial [Acidobacteria bacterium]|nr:amidohydrolase [Acidobacteriota bacterium]
MRKLTLLLALLLPAASAFAADLPRPIVLRAARLIDGRGDTVIAPAVVVIRGNIIASVNGTVPPDAETIDLGDATLLPGLID